MDDPFIFIEKHYNKLQALCVRMCRGRRDLVDDLWDACVLDRTSGILATYDPNVGASQLTHVYRNLTWYMWKWMNKHAKTRHVYPDESAYHDSLNLENVEEVQYLMSGLSQYDRDILIMRVVDEMTFAEIGVVIGKCKCTARNHYHKALRRVQDAKAHD